MFSLSDSVKYFRLGQRFNEFITVRTSVSVFITLDVIISFLRNREGREIERSNCLALGGVCLNETLRTGLRGSCLLCVSSDM